MIRTEVMKKVQTDIIQYKNDMKVILISGHAQNGKDTTASMLMEKLTADGYKVLITHYADLLKYICKAFFGWDGNKDERGRTLLQYVGTDVIRKKAPDFWVDFISRILSYFDGDWDYVIIPDTRFPNEINRLKTDGFDVIHLRIVRSGFPSPLTPEQQRHPSETALDNTKPDYYIYNNSSLENLNSKIIEWVKENLYGYNSQRIL